LEISKQTQTCLQLLQRIEGHSRLTLPFTGRTKTNEIPSSAMMSLLSITAEQQQSGAIISNGEVRADPRYNALSS
jgi:hypothetical protein